MKLKLDENVDVRVAAWLHLGRHGMIQSGSIQEYQLVELEDVE